MCIFAEQQSQQAAYTYSLSSETALEQDQQQQLQSQMLQQQLMLQQQVCSLTTVAAIAQGSCRFSDTAVCRPWQEAWVSCLAENSERSM